MSSEVVHIYQRPNIGSGFIARFPAFQYRHSIAATRGFDTASFQIAVHRQQAEKFVSNYLGCRVHVYKDNPAESIWEGYISRVTLNAGGVVYTRSLEEMMNSVRGLYSNGTSTPGMVAVANNLSSQAIYGIKQGSPDNGTNLSGAAGVLRDTILGQAAYPQSSVIFNSGAGDFVLNVECKGYSHWLDWAIIYDTDTTARAVTNPPGATAIIPRMFVTDVYPNASFFDYDNGTDWVEANTTQSNMNNMTGGNATFWDVIQKICEMGNGTTPFVAGISRTLTTGNRKFYYRAANLNVEYLVRTTDGIVRNRFGRVVKPWLVQPDRKCYISDLNVGIDVVDGDPREFYVAQVDYDSGRNSVQLKSSDDITPEGAFRLRHKNNRVGVRFGATSRRQL